MMSSPRLYRLQSLALTSSAIFLFTCSGATAATFYSQGNTVSGTGAGGTGANPLTLTVWDTNPTGGGTDPINFSNSADLFNIQNTHVVDIASGGWTLAGGLVVNNGGYFRLANSAANSLGSLTIDSGGTVYLNTGSNIRTLTLNGNLVNNGTMTNLNNGQTTTLRFAGTSAWTGSGNLSGSRTVFAVDSGATLDVSGIDSGVTFRSTGTLNSTVSGTLIAGTRTLSGNGNSGHTFNLASGASLVTGHANGVNGTFNWAGTLNLNTGANYTFNGAVAQVTGTLMPATVNNLTILNASTVSMSQATTVSGTLSVGGSASGTLNLAGFNHSASALTVSSNSTLMGDGSVTTTVNNLVLINGTLQVGQPGATLGQDFSLSTSGTGSSSFGPSSRLELDLWSTTGMDQSSTLAAADRLQLFGNMSITNGSVLKLGNPNALTFQLGDVFRLFDWTGLGTRTGTFTEDFSAITLNPGLFIDTSNLYTLGTIRIDAIPEPSRAVLLIAGCISMVLHRRRPSPQPRPFASRA